MRWGMEMFHGLGNMEPMGCHNDRWTEMWGQEHLVIMGSRWVEKKRRGNHEPTLVHSYLKQANSQSRGLAWLSSSLLYSPPSFSPSDLTFLPCAHTFNWVWDLSWCWPPRTQALKFLECIFCLSTRGVTETQTWAEAVLHTDEEHHHWSQSPFQILTLSLVQSLKLFGS